MIKSIKIITFLKCVGKVGIQNKIINIIAHYCTLKIYYFCIGLQILHATLIETRMRKSYMKHPQYEKNTGI